MPRSETIVSVFLSSPSDVASERSICEEVISELNSLWSRELGIRFELIRWEKDSRPGFGTDPQSVINDQLEMDYDVFLGILWGRIGTPTPRAASGTLEEFENAYSRFQADPSSVDIMFYFKDAGIPPSKMDPGQLEQILSFRASLPSKGGLYATFEDSHSFATSLRSHLASLAQQISSKMVDSPQAHIDQINHQDQDTLLEEDELGLFEYVDLYEDRMDEITQTLDSISSATEKMGAELNQRTQEAYEIQAQGNDPRKAKAILRVASDNIDHFAKSLERDVHTYSGARTEAFDALSSALSLYEEFKEPADIEDLESGLSSMAATLPETSESLVAFKEALIMLPKLTTALNRSKRRAVQQLDFMLDELSGTRSTVENVLASIGKMKGY